MIEYGFHAFPLFLFIGCGFSVTFSLEFPDHFGHELFRELQVSQCLPFCLWHFRTIQGRYFAGTIGLIG
jgi:hypothetical protein